MIKMYKCVEFDTLPSNTADQVKLLRSKVIIFKNFENEVFCWILNIFFK